MLYNRILLIGANIIAYEILSYIYNYCDISNTNIYIYDDNILHHRDNYRLSWWLNDINEKISSSKMCVKKFNKCISITKDDLNKFNEYPEVVIFTSSHIIKDTNSFNKLIDKFKHNGSKIIMAMNHHLYGYYNNCLNDDIKYNVYSLNHYVRHNDRINNNLVDEYVKYIYSCSKSTEQDDMPECFKMDNMNSIFYPLSSILSMMVIRDIVEEWIDTSLIIDWSLLKNNNVYLTRIDEDDYKYIETGKWMNNLRTSKLLIDVNDEGIFDSLIKQLYNLGYFRHNNGVIYVLCDKDYNNDNKKIKYIRTVTRDIINNIDFIICISNDYKRKKNIDDICIQYLKPSIFINKYNSIPFIEIVSNVPNVTQTYNESEYSILDKLLINDYKVDWRMNIGLSMLIVQWMIYNKISDIENIKFKKYMSSRIDKKIIWNISKKCKDYYNNSYNDDYKRIIYTIPDTFNNWTRINVYHNTHAVNKLDGLLSHLQDEYGLVPYKIMYENELLYDKEKYMNNKNHINRLLKPWIYKRINERYNVIMIFKLYCKDTNGDELICPPVYFHCSK